MRGVAAGLVGKFLSRNNDVNGYWALGVLYRSAAKLGTDEFLIDLISGESSPSTKYSRDLAKPFTAFAYDQIIKLGFAREQLTEASVKLSFCVDPTPAQIRGRSTWGDPFVCEVTLTDDLGKSWTYKARGWCAVHDPVKEHRSNRVTTSWWSWLR